MTNYRLDDRPSARGQGKCAGLSRATCAPKSALRTCLPQRPGAGGHQGDSAFDLALSLALDAAEWLIEHSTNQRKNWELVRYGA